MAIKTNNLQVHLGLRSLFNEHCIFTAKGTVSIIFFKKKRELEHKERFETLIEGNRVLRLKISKNKSIQIQIFFK